MLIRVRHARCRGHLIDLFFPDLPTLKEVAARGAAMLAHDFRHIGRVSEPWPQECDWCGAALRFEPTPQNDGVRQPVLVGMIGSVVNHG